MKVKNESKVIQLCQTLSDPMDWSLPGSSVHGIFQTRVLEWGAIAFSITVLELSKDNYARNKLSKIFENNPHIFKCSVTFTKRIMSLTRNR